MLVLNPNALKRPSPPSGLLLWSYDPKLSFRILSSKRGQLSPCRVRQVHVVGPVRTRIATHQLPAHLLHKNSHQDDVGYMNNYKVIVVMGVSGSGKSTVGRLLSERLGCDFLEGDSLHPPSNIAKMASGTPLTDQDRWPWLAALHSVIQQHLSSDSCLVVSCSALKPAYRNILMYGKPVIEQHSRSSNLTGPDRSPVDFVLLDPPVSLLRRRLAARQEAGGHFFPPSLLDSQMAALSYKPDELLAHVTARQVALMEGGGLVGCDEGRGVCGREEGTEDGGWCFPEPQSIVDQLVALLLT